MSYTATYRKVILEKHSYRINDTSRVEHPLMYAIKHQNAEAVKSLLEHGADINLMKNILHQAVRTQNMDIIEIILNLMINQDITELMYENNTSMETPVILAVQAQNSAIVERLMNQ